MLEARRITTMMNMGPSLYSVALSLAQSHSLSLSLSLSVALSQCVQLAPHNRLALSFAVSLSLSLSLWKSAVLVAYHLATHNK
jgi:hypothetical protein